PRATQRIDDQPHHDVSRDAPSPQLSRIAQRRSRQTPRRLIEIAGVVDPGCAELLVKERRGPRRERIEASDLGIGVECEGATEIETGELAIAELVFQDPAPDVRPRAVHDVGRERQRPGQLAGSAVPLLGCDVRAGGGEELTTAALCRDDARNESDEPTQPQEHAELSY